MDTPTSTQHQLYWWAQGQPTKHPKNQQKEKQASTTYIHTYIIYFLTHPTTKQNPNRNKQNRKPPNSQQSQQHTSSSSSKTSAATYWDELTPKKCNKQAWDIGGVVRREIFGKSNPDTTKLLQYNIRIKKKYIVVRREIFGKSNPDTTKLLQYKLFYNNIFPRERLMRSLGQNNLLVSGISEQRARAWISARNLSKKAWMIICKIRSPKKVFSPSPKKRE